MVGQCATQGGCGAGDLSTLAMLLDAGLDAGARDRWNGYTPLHCAAASGHVACAEALLAHGADPRALSNLGEPAAALGKLRLP